MSTVAIWMFYETGHLLPTLRLARGLQAAGHRVVYFVPPDFEEKVRGLGFEAVPVLAESIPPGTLRRLHQAPDSELPALQGQITLSTYFALLTDGVAEPLRAVAPDLLLFDSQLWGLAMAAEEAGIPCCRLCTTLPGWAPGVPPITSALPFGDTRQRLAAVEKAWDEAQHRWDHIPFKKEIDEVIGMIFEKYDYPEEWVDKRAAFYPDMVRVPELVLCSPALDYPRPPERLLWIESIELEREPADFPWDRLHEGRERLIFCSLGSQVYRYEGAGRFFREVVAAARARPDWQLVLAIGSRLDPEELGPIPENALVVPFAPQVELLPECDLVMTHGGLGTVKESLYFGKPMLVFPLDYDQPGNGARVAHHGLGEVGGFRTVTATELVAMVERVLGDPERPARLAAVRSSFTRLEDSQPGVAFVERRLEETG